MFNIIKTRLRQKHRTIAYPKQPPSLPDRFRGFPLLGSGVCAEGCAACSEVCPTNAVTSEKSGGLQLDMGKCVLCGKCAEGCPAGLITFSKDHRLAASTREACVAIAGQAPPLASPLPPKLLSLFKRSLKIRVVSAGGCNACEADINVLSTIVFDIGRFGIQYVASPRHADAMLVTGAAPRNMHAAIKKTYDAIPDPKIVIAVGACAISGGLFAGHTQECAGVAALVPVDLFIPGCPPHPITILDGLLRILDTIKGSEPPRGSVIHQADNLLNNHD